LDVGFHLSVTWISLRAEQPRPLLAPSSRGHRPLAQSSTSAAIAIDPGHADWPRSSWN
jgi:hypothetical protein